MLLDFAQHKKQNSCQWLSTELCLKVIFVGNQVGWNVMSLDIIFLNNTEFSPIFNFYWELKILLFFNL